MPWTEESKRRMVASRKRNKKARAKSGKMLPSVIEQVQQQRQAAATQDGPQSIDKLAQLIIAVARNL